jgi:hypothetical protein
MRFVPHRNPADGLTELFSPHPVAAHGTYFVLLLMNAGIDHKAGKIMKRADT